MSTYSYTIYANKSALIDWDGNNDHVSLQNKIKSYGSDMFSGIESALLVGFDAGDVIAQLQGKIITGARIYFYVSDADSYWYNDTTDKDSYTRIYTNSVVMRNGETWDEVTVTDEDLFLGIPDEGGYSRNIYLPEFTPGYYETQLGTLSIENIERYISATVIRPDHRIYHIYEATVKTSRDTNKPYITISAKDSVPVSTPISPLNVYKNNAAEIRLQWEYSNPSGGSQNGFQIQYKDALSTEWTDLAQSVASAETYYDVPANTFAAGAVQWRVKVTNIWDIESEWSTTATFEALGAPAAPGVSATNSPRPNITWVAEDQQAYEIKIDAEPSAFFFGGNKEYKAKKYYPDGPLTISVKTQNSYGLWSEWGEMTVNIVNIPGSEINLAAQGNVLEWNLTEHTAYYVYRDGVPIAKTTQTQYEDLSATGKHIYRVRGVSGDNYSLSNEITLNVIVSAPQIADINNISKWVELKYSTSQDRTLSIFVRQDVIYQYYAGRQYPVAEMSPQTTKTFSFNVAFKTTEEAREFEALLGKTVVYKDQHGRRIVGPLVGYETNVSGFFNSYTCSIQQTDVIEAVEYD